MYKAIDTLTLLQYSLVVVLSLIWLCEIPTYPEFHTTMW